MMNVRFEYLYRDAGNYKNWGELVCSNPHNIDIDVMTSLMENVLIEKSYFVASKAGIPDLHFERYNEELDHGWHEFHAFVTTEEAANDLLERNIEEFIESLRYAASEKNLF